MSFAPQPLKRLVEPSRSITYGIVQAGEHVVDGVPYIRPIDMNGHSGVDAKSLQRTSPKIAAAYSRSSLRTGDVVVSIGPSFGKTMRVPAELDGANLTQGTARVAVRQGVAARFVLWCLQSKTSTSFWESSVGGATFRALNLGPLTETPIPSPPLRVQQQIAEYLDHETAEIDALIADLAMMKQLSYERRSATIASAFEERCKLAPLKRYGHLQSGLTLGAAYSEPTELFPYLRVANVQAGRVVLDDIAEVRLPPALARRYLLREGDVLLTEGGDRDKLGRGALWNERHPMLHQNHVFAFRCNSQLVPEFLVYALEAPSARRYFDVTARQSTNLASTNSSIVLSFPLRVPSVTEQRAIIHHLDFVISQIAEEISDTDAAIALAQERRAALITAAVTGQIDVTAKQTPAVDSIQIAIEDAR